MDRLNPLALMPRVDSDPASAQPRGLGEGAGFSRAIRPVKYRYVLADIRTGELIALLPMTSASYTVGIYEGQEMKGTVYLPDLWLDLMAYPPNHTVFKRIRHPDRAGLALATLFEIGNVALYVMRNDQVVWGGILWSRDYSSGNKTMEITAVSFDAYIYYRAMRQSVVFRSQTDKYTIARAVLNQTFNDFTLTGTSNGVVNDSGQKNPARPWTGWIKNNKSSQTLGVDAQSWPSNANPRIELPPTSLKCGITATADREEWYGWNMSAVGTTLQQWASTDEVLEDLSGFEYRVICWWDAAQQKFRQAYVFGEVGGTLTSPSTWTFVDRFFGNKRVNAGNIVFDFPGHISEWSLRESMEDAATRVIATDAQEGASKNAEFYGISDLLKPGGSTSRGWLLYDYVLSTDYTSISSVRTVGKKERSRRHPPLAASINDLGGANTGKRTSQNATDLSVKLYADPTTPFPDWGIGDWVTFAIDDPFYGGRMYLQRRIMKYSVEVTPDHESDYSHESISLDLNDPSEVVDSA